MSSINNVKPKLNLDPSQVTQPRKNEKVMKAAQMYEQQFLREMLKAMRNTVQESDLIPTSQGERIYREQMDHHYVEKWGERGGVGLADMIYSHIMEKYFSNSSGMAKPVGPMPLESKGQFRLQQGTTPAAGLAPAKGANLFLERLSTSPGKAAEDVVSPWAGKVAYEQEGDGFIQLRIDHDNGVSSRLRFEGMKSADLRTGGQVEAGQKMGSLSPESKGIFWSMETKT
ncbi:MAG: rod-binding protein [Bdellovibrionales bacterium]